MDPLEPLKKPGAIFKPEGPLEVGCGKVTGIIAFSLAVLCMLGVLAFHYPEYLTTPELRKNYSVDLLRQVMLWAMVIAGGIGIGNLVLRRNRWLNGTALVLVLLTVVAGGHQVPVGDFPDNTPYIGLDWFILDLLGSTMIFILIEKLFPIYEQPVFRRGWQTDFNHANVKLPAAFGRAPLKYLIVTPDFHHWHHSSEQEALDRNYAAHFAFIDYLFGTAVKSDRRFPEKYAVLGDYMPDGFFKQQLFPFIWKG